MTPTEAGDYAASVGGLVVRLLILLATIALFCLILDSVAGATECRAQQGDSGYWSWRQIDNRKCWYKGSAGMPKSQLHWPERRHIDPVFPKGSSVKTVKPEEFTELDAQADTDSFFEAKPILMWESVMRLVPFIPWQERIAGALQ